MRLRDASGAVGLGLAAWLLASTDAWAQIQARTGFEVSEGYVDAPQVLNAYAPASLTDIGWTSAWYSTGNSQVVVGNDEDDDPFNDKAPGGGDQYFYGLNGEVSRRDWGLHTSQRFAFKLKVRLASDQPADNPVFSGLPGARFQVEETPSFDDAVDLEIFNSATWFRVRTSQGSRELDPYPDLPVNTWFDLVITFDLDSQMQKVQYSLEVGGPLHTLMDGAEEWFAFERSAIANVSRITINGRGSGSTGSQISVSVDDVVVDLEVPTEPCESSVAPLADQVATAIEGQGAMPSQLTYALENFGTISHDYTVQEIAPTGTSIAGLHHTGTDDAGAALGERVLDPHWTLIEGGLDGSCTEQNPCPTYTVIQDGFPIPSSWPANDATSRWITADPLDDNAVAPSETHIFRTTFTLPDQAAVDAAIVAGRVLVDNRLVQVQINGIPTDPPISVSQAGFARWHSFAVTDGFQVGTNTLDFEVGNWTGAANPLGLRVEFFDLPAGDMPWLSTNRPAPFTIASASRDTVTALIDPSSLAPGVYTGFLRITSDCADPGPETFVRAVQLTVTNWEVTPAEDVARGVVGLEGDCAPPTPVDVPFAITNIGQTTVDYTVAQATPCDWLTLDRDSGQVTAGNSEIVTATLDASSLAMGDHQCRLMFTNVGTGLPVETRIITLSVVGTVWEYLGGVDPVSADSAGPGLNFIVDDGVSQGTVESDLKAINGLVWRILDTADLSTEFRTQPNVSFAGEVGMTIVARVRVRDHSGSASPGLFIWERDDGLAAGYHWGGAATGLVLEKGRGMEATLGADDKFHMLRMTAQGVDDDSRTINLYFDEDPTPVISIPYGPNTRPTQ